MWTRLLESDKAITSIFEQTPKLDSVRLYEITLREVEPQLILRLDLNEYPDKPPKKWNVAKCNTVQIHLGLSEVRDLKMTNWSTDNIVSLEFTTLDRGFLLSINGSFEFQCKAEYLTLNSISAYQNEE